MLRPSAIAFAIVAKLSSARTISAAFFATSVPVIPIAIPTSAVFKEGASFTPSPVIATVFPIDFSADTMRILCSGETCAYTLTRDAAAASSGTDIFCKSLPVIHSCGSEAIPNSRAIASAVSLLSPVIMTVRTPAFLKSCTAFAASGRMGSFMPASPRKIMSLSWGEESPVRMARARTRKAWEVSLSRIRRISLRLWEVSGRIFPFSRIWLDFPRTSSGDPFV